ncbi:MAG: hypothetical protein QM691_03370 [Opitutaceae bacterium]
MSEPGNFIPPEPGGFVPPEPGNFVPEFSGEAAKAPTAVAPGAPPPRKVSRRSADQLGLVWVRGTLHIAARRQRKLLGQWSSPAPVRTVEELAAALDGALAELKFEGTDTFLVYEGDAFVHQPEAAPAFSAAATRSYLQNKVARYAKEKGPVLWAAQPALGLKGEKSFVLHLMAQDFYNQLHRVLVARRLDLTRIFPLVVPVLREMSGFPLPKGVPVLVAAEAADATIIVVAQAGGALLFSRLILASLEESPERAAIEINRSLLYAKQQFNAAVDRIWLVTRTGRANEEVSAKCGAGKMVMVLPTQPVEWVTAAARVARTHPVNLISGYIRRKRRDQFIRLGLLAIGWLGLANYGQQLWNHHEAWRLERDRISTVAARHEELRLERDALLQRNDRSERARQLSQALDSEVLPPVPSRLLGHLATLLPADARLVDFAARWDAEAGRWTFRCEGLISGDEEAVRDAVAALQAALAAGPLRARFAENQAATGRGPGTGSGQQRFIMEGTLFAD